MINMSQNCAPNDIEWDKSMNRKLFNRFLVYMLHCRRSLSHSRNVCRNLIMQTLLRFSLSGQSISSWAKEKNILSQFVLRAVRTLMLFMNNSVAIFYCHVSTIHRSFFAHANPLHRSTSHYWQALAFQGKMRRFFKFDTFPPSMKRLTRANRKLFSRDFTFLFLFNCPIHNL